MSINAELRRDRTKLFTVMAAGIGILLFWAAIAFPTLHRSRSELETSAAVAREPVASYFTDLDARQQGHLTAGAVGHKAEISKGEVSPASSQKIVRTGSIDLIVQHPAEVAEEIRVIAVGYGGYLETSKINGAEATSGSLTIRVPSGRFEEARKQITSLGLRVEGENIEARDVTLQYVDQEANLRNLHAEEAQYLTILKQAVTVKDALAVSEKLSEVRGQIEQQQSEFNALAKQTETVAIAVALRTEAEAQALWLNWRPMYQLKLAFRDGLEAVASYATAMIGVLFYLPAVILWVGTILGSLLLGWRLLLWGRRRWFGALPEQKSA